MNPEPLPKLSSRNDKSSSGISPTSSSSVSILSEEVKALKGMISMAELQSKDRLNTYIANFKKEKSHIQAEYDRSLMKVKDMETSKQELNIEMQKISKENQILSDTTEALKVEKSALLRNLYAAERERDILKKEKFELFEEIKEQQRDQNEFLEKNRREKQEFEEKLMGLQRSHREEKNHLNGHICDLELKISTLTGQKQKLEEDMESYIYRHSLQPKNVNVSTTICTKCSNESENNKKDLGETAQHIHLSDQLEEEKSRSSILEGQLEKIRLELAYLKSEYEKEKNKVSLHERKIASLESDNKGTTEQFQFRSENLVSEIKIIKNSNDDLKKKCRDYEDALLNIKVAHQNEILSLKRSEQSSTEKIKALTNTLDEEQYEKENMKTEMKKQETVASEMSKTWFKEKVELENHVKQLETSQATILETHENELEYYKKELQCYKEKVDQIENINIIDGNVMRNKVQALQDTISKLENNKKMETTEFQNYKKNYDTLQHNHKKLLHEKENWQYDIQELDSKVSKLKSSLQSALDEVDFLRKERDSERERVKEKEHYIEDKKMEILSLKGKLSNLRGQIVDQRKVNCLNFGVDLKSPPQAEGSTDNVKAVTSTIEEMKSNSFNKEINKIPTENSISSTKSSNNMRSIDDLNTSTSVVANSITISSSMDDFDTNNSTKNKRTNNSNHQNSKKALNMNVDEHGVVNLEEGHLSSSVRQSVHIDRNITPVNNTITDLYKISSNTMKITTRYDEIIKDSNSPEEIVKLPRNTDNNSTHQANVSKDISSSCNEKNSSHPMSLNFQNTSHTKEILQQQLEEANKRGTNENGEKENQIKNERHIELLTQPSINSQKENNSDRGNILSNKEFFSSQDGNTKHIMEHDDFYSRTKAEEWTSNFYGDCSSSNISSLTSLYMNHQSNAPHVRGSNQYQDQQETKSLDRKNFGYQDSNLLARAKSADALINSKSSPSRGERFMEFAKQKSDGVQRHECGNQLENENNLNSDTTDDEYYRYYKNHISNQIEHERQFSPKHTRPFTIGGTGEVLGQCFLQPRRDKDKSNMEKKNIAVDSTENDSDTSVNYFDWLGGAQLAEEEDQGGKFFDYQNRTNQTDPNTGKENQEYHYSNLDEDLKRYDSLESHNSVYPLKNANGNQNSFNTSWASTPITSSTTRTKTTRKSSDKSRNNGDSKTTALSVRKATNVKEEDPKVNAVRAFHQGVNKQRMKVPPKRVSGDTIPSKAITIATMRNKKGMRTKINHYHDTKEKEKSIRLPPLHKL